MVFHQFAMHRQLRIPLWQIDPKPERIKHCAAGTIIGGYIFGILLLATIVLMCIYRERSVTFGLCFPLFFFVVMLLSCLWKYHKESINCLCYHLRGGGQILLWFELPDPQKFAAFCDLLSKKSAEAWENRPASNSSFSLAGEIKELSKLRDAGTLSEAEFEKAKAKLIELTEKRHIGFV